MHSLVSSGCYEVDAAVDAAVRNVLLAFDADLFVQVQLKLVIDVIQHRLPTAHTDTYTHTYVRTYMYIHNDTCTHTLVLSECYYSGTTERGSPGVSLPPSPRQGGMNTCNISTT